MGKSNIFPHVVSGPFHPFVPLQHHFKDNSVTPGASNIYTAQILSRFRECKEVNLQVTSLCDGNKGSMCAIFLSNAFQNPHHEGGPVPNAGHRLSHQLLES